TGGSFSGGPGIEVTMVGGAGTFLGKLTNNQVGTATANSGTGQASAAGIGVDVEGNNGSNGPNTGPSEVLISGNTIQQYGEEGLLLRANSGGVTVHATVFGHTIKN